MFDAIYSLLEDLDALSEQSLTPRQRHLLTRRKEELMDELVLRVRKSYKWQKIKTHERLASKQVRGDNVIDVHKNVLKTPYGKFDVEMWEGPLTMKKRVMVYRILIDGKETTYNEQRSVRAAKDVVERLVAKKMLQDVWPDEKAKILAP